MVNALYFMWNFLHFNEAENRYLYKLQFNIKCFICGYFYEKQSCFYMMDISSMVND